MRLYDSTGIPGNTATALAQTTVPLFGADEHETFEVGLEPLLAAAGNATGFYLVETVHEVFFAPYLEEVADRFGDLPNIVGEVFNEQDQVDYLDVPAAVVAYRRWLHLADQTTRGTEDAWDTGPYGPHCTEWEIMDMGSVDSPRPGPPILRPDDGPLEKPVWNSEWAGHYPLTRSDQAFVHGWNDGGLERQALLTGMSGSLTLGRKNAARAVRHVLVSLQHGTTLLLHFGGLAGDLGGEFRWFEMDNTPTVMPAAQSHLADRLEGYAFHGAFWQGQLSDNGVNPAFTRTLLFVERDPVDPQDPRAVAVLWNWASEEIDGDGVDPPHSGDPTVVPVIALDPDTQVEVTDLMGRELEFAGSTVTDLEVGPEPVYLRTLSGTSWQALAQALDTERPTTPTKVTGIGVFGSAVVVPVSETFDDVQYRYEYVENATGYVAAAPMVWSDAVWVFH